MAESPRTYPHRANFDGTFDAICPDCLRTISSEDTEAQLGQWEQNHACNPIDIECLWKGKPFYIRQ